MQYVAPDDVQVDIYPDVQWGERGPAWTGTPEAVAMTQGDSEGVLDLVRGYGPQAGLGILALVSLTMMLRVVRKSSQLIHVSSRSEGSDDIPGAEELLTVGMRPVGQAAASESQLVGREVDDESLRYVELSEEVSKLVREDAESAAAMIQRWAQNAE